VPEAQVISIVDDDARVRVAIRRLVQSLGYAALTFPSADDFFQSGQVAETACLILDVKMPGMSGLELQERLAAAGDKTPIIFITACAEEFRAHALDAGAVGFLTKPFREEELTDCLKVALSDPK